MATRGWDGTIRQVIYVVLGGEVHERERRVSELVGDTPLETLYCEDGGEAAVAGACSPSLFGPRAVWLRDGENLSGESAARLAGAVADPVVITSGEARLAITARLSEARVISLGREDAIERARSWAREAGVSVEPGVLAGLAALIEQDAGLARSALTVIGRGEDAESVLDAYRGEGGGAPPWHVAEAVETGRVGDLDALTRGRDLTGVAVYLSRRAWQLRALGEASPGADLASLLGVSAGAAGALARRTRALGPAVVSQLIDGWDGLDTRAKAEGSEAVRLSLLRLAEQIRGVRRRVRG